MSKVQRLCLVKHRLRRDLIKLTIKMGDTSTGASSRSLVLFLSVLASRNLGGGGGGGRRISLGVLKNTFPSITAYRYTIEIINQTVNIESNFKISLRS